MDNGTKGLPFDAAWCVATLLAALLGCGGGSSDPEGTANQPGEAGGAALTPPVAAIATEAGKTEAGSFPVDVAPGSPEAFLVEITKLVAAANADVARQRAVENADGTAAEPEVPDDVQVSTLYRRRLERIIELATQVIASTHTQTEQEQQFNNAVHYLSDARLELASAGDAVQAELLIEDADSLFERDAGSFAAAEAGFKVVELAQRMAESFGADDSDWLREYANQVVRFSQRFPDQQGRAAMSLFSAGRICDRRGQPDEARRCFRLLRQQYADSVFAEQSAGFWRRLSLPGQPIELSGPTIDGGFVDMDQYRGRVVLVVFWASTSPTFQEQFPALARIESQFAGRGLSIIGVNLDADEAAVDRFLTDHGVSWPQIFSADPNQRGGRNPVARYYSVQVLPAYWLIDKTGTVVEAPVSVADLPQMVQKLINDL